MNEVFDSVGKVEILIYTNIQECTSKDDDKVEAWQEAVEEFLWGIPNVSEIGCYGSYYFKVTYPDLSDIQEKIQFVKQKLNEWQPPFSL